ncbi:MAG TPA: saccharopine dehydrogenase NADP-binding domain-containing protein [Solirubrobacterales bacterium]|nr:saccharopine dehydrogenase NADP-binding domain-containing protein [Solirubrobacterales bacterium]
MSPAPSGAGMTVAVLGAGGTIAPAIVRDLAESDEMSGLILLDVHKERAEAVAREHGGSRAQVRTADARSGLAAQLAGCDVLVNAASYRINLAAMRACLEAGCHYIDLGGLYWLTGQQLELHDEFERAGLLALLGMGSSPGKTNVMAVKAARELGAAAERVDVLAAGRDMRPPAGPSYPYAVQTLVDELTMRPIVIRDMEPVEIDPLTPGGLVDFDDPIGEEETIYTLHSEMRTFPESFRCAEGSFRLSLPPAVLERVRALIGAPPEEIEAAAAEASPPSSETVSVHAIDAFSGGRKTRVRAVTTPVERWGLGGGVVSTGAPAAAAVRLLARGRIEARGALPPERCVDPDDLFPELEGRGTTFETNSGISLAGSPGSSEGANSVGIRA